MDLKRRKTRYRLAAAAAVGGVVFLAIGLLSGYAAGWICLGIAWIVVAILALVLDARA